MLWLVEIPYHLRLDKLILTIRTFMGEKCVFVDGYYLCGLCGAAIVTYEAHLHLYTDKPSRKDNGSKVWILPLPYCPHCQHGPETHGSLNVPSLTLDRSLPKAVLRYVKAAISMPPG
jgi:hypothetical protein